MCIAFSVILGETPPQIGASESDPVSDRIDPGLRADIVKIGARRARYTDAADDASIALVHHQPAAQRQSLAQLTYPG